MMNGNKNKLDENLDQNEWLHELKMKGILKPMLNGKEDNEDIMKVELYDSTVRVRNQDSYVLVEGNRHITYHMDTGQPAKHEQLLPRRVTCSFYYWSVQYRTRGVGSSIYGLSLKKPWPKYGPFVDMDMKVYGHEDTNN